MRVLLALLVLTPQAAFAQAVEQPFAGARIGLGLAGAQNHFEGEITDLRTGLTQVIEPAGYGVLGDVSLGYDLRIAPRVILGGEAALQAGGASVSYQLPELGISRSPRFAYTLTARLGYVPLRRVLVYAGGGYGEDYQRLRTRGNVDAAALSNGVNRSFLLSAGMEYALGRHLALRGEFQHLDNSRNALRVGAQLRF